VLGFIGVKLVLHYAHTLSPDVPEISTALSLIIVVGVLAATTIISLLWPRKSASAEPTRTSLVLDPALAAATSRALRPVPEELAARPLQQQDDDGDVDEPGDQRQQSAARRTGLHQ
jgi:hypothetical protein